MLRILKHFLAIFTLLIALCAGMNTASAADVPVVGIATGDATRGPLVDYLQAIRTLRIRTPGYDLISPEDTAELVDRIAAAPPPPKPIPGEVDRLMRAADDALANEEYLRARNELTKALELVERGDGTIPLGENRLWEQIRVGLAEAWVLDQPGVKERRRSADTVPDEGIAGARAALEPIFDVNPDFELPGNPDPIYGEVFSRLKAEVRRTGTLTINSPGRGAPVYVNGYKIGQTPLAEYRLTAGTWEVQAGKKEQPSRIHLAEVPPGDNVEVQVDPSFEFGLTTQGYAIVEAPPGQSAAVSAVQVGSGTARLTGNRYALVFAVEGAQPLLLYAAMVDGETNVVLRERTVEVAPGAVDSTTLNALLLYVIEGKEVDDSWPAARWGWIISGTATVGLLVPTIIFAVEAADKFDKYETVADDEEAERFKDEAETAQTIAFITGGLSAVALGLTIYFAIVDANTEEGSEDFVQSGDWWFYASPVENGGAAGFTVVW